MANNRLYLRAPSGATFQIARSMGERWYAATFCHRGDPAAFVEALDAWLADPDTWGEPDDFESGMGGRPTRLEVITEATHFAEERLANGEPPRTDADYALRGIEPPPG